MLRRSVLTLFSTRQHGVGELFWRVQPLRYWANMSEQTVIRIDIVSDTI